MVKQTSPKLESIIDLLCDGNCHSQSELQKTAQLNEHQTREVVAFLTEFGLAEISDKNKKLKLTVAAKKLFTKVI
jgi:DNA-binding IclR family transcriptional regulator